MGAPHMALACRVDREKEASGIPDIPTPGRLVELEYAAISDRRMRSQLRNPGEIEKTVRPFLAVLALEARPLHACCNAAALVLRSP